MVLGHMDILYGFARLAEEEKLGHAYLFFGPGGVGKGTAAEVLVRYFETGSWECDQEDHRPLSDCLIISPVGGTIGIEMVREMREFLNVKPVASKYRAVVIKEAETMTREAQNALLKSTEEPPGSGLVFLTVRDPGALLPTLVSRFQKHFFGPVKNEAIANWLVKEKGYPIGKAKQAASRSFGRPGLAVSLLGDEIFLGRDTLAREFLSINPSERKMFVKKLVEDDAFRLDEFLDSLIFVLADGGLGDRDLWHRVVELRRVAEFTNVNPRLQLMALV